MIVTLLLGIAAGYRAMGAFADPTPAYDGDSGISIGIEGGESSVAISIDNQLQYNPELTAYGFILPLTAVGKRFTVLLTGSAMLDSPISRVGLKVSKPKCEQFGDPVACELLTGVIPHPRIGGGIGYVRACNDEMVKVASGVSILIAGRPRNVLRQSWATQVVAEPNASIMDEGRPQDSLIDDNETLIPESFEIPDAMALCTRFAAPDDYLITGARPAAEKGSDQEVVWTGLLDRQASISLRRVNSGEVANALLLLAGLLFGSSSGFLAMWATEDPDSLTELDRPARP
ncbi:hypothetical protein [Modestobacter sp. NPDC013298]|uniref:hypothetical protein n=1 Tax=Modestobacter sp. NPDC013298 TaxID=3155464 RepID=UPI0033DDE394